MGSGGDDEPSPSNGQASVSPSERSTTKRDDGAGANPDHGKIKEIGGPKGPEPTRYGDWEKGGRCSDF